MQIVVNTHTHTLNMLTSYTIVGASKLEVSNEYIEGFDTLLFATSTLLCTGFTNVMVIVGSFEQLTAPGLFALCNA